MGKKVFISHSSKDSKTATAICVALEARGHQCWMSSRDIKPGENFQGTIVRAIREAGVMVLVFSANANNSDEIKKEMALASQSRKMVIPVRAEDVLPSEDFTYELATRQWIDMFVDWEKSIEVLSHQVGEAVPKEDIGVRPPPPPSVSPTRKSPAPVFAIVALLLLAGGAAAYWSTRSSAPAPASVSAPLAAPVASVAPAAQPSSGSGMNAQLESQLWDSVKTSNDVSVVQSYLDKYPNGTFTAVAKARLAELNNPAQAAKAHTANNGLASMDAEIAAMYKRARANAVDTSAVADEQTAWLARRASCGGDPGCLRHSYAERRAELSRWITGD
ncbi:MAG: TIR domain-containing protein [Alphaproteobacteria bacterium]|nr:TIR domain-containing protein [Alphaproteobacteria bacterium]